MEADADAFRAVGARRRFALLREDTRRRVCALYVARRHEGYAHDEAAWVVRNDPQIKALPLWASLLVSLLLQALWTWWKNRNPDNG